MSQSALVTQNQGFLATLPIGVILAWHRDLATSYVPSLPAGWVACDGQTLDDLESPLHGLVIPDLNGQARFLRGGATSGALQDDQMQSHVHEDPGHAHTDGGHDHASSVWLGIPNAPLFPGGLHELRADGSTGVGHANIQPATANLGNPEDSDTGAGPARHGDETRPVNMSVVWIIKVKQVVSARAVPALQAHPDASPGALYIASGGQVGLGTDTPDEHAALHIESQSRGVLLPRMTSGQRGGIAGPPEGLEVYDTTAHAMFVHDGTEWQRLGWHHETILRGSVKTDGTWAGGSAGVESSKSATGTYDISFPALSDPPTVVVTGNASGIATDNVFSVSHRTNSGFRVHSKDVEGVGGGKYQDAPFSFIAIGY